MIHETERAGQRGNAESGSQRFACLLASNTLNTADPECNQEKTTSVGPLPGAAAEADEFLLDEIFHDLSLIWSYATSAMEAARRGDRDELKLRLRVQLRDCFRHAVKLHDLLSTEQRKGGVA
jgi:hypothetical protein